MNKKLKKISFILWALFLICLFSSVCNGAKIYLEPQAMSFVSNCPNTLNIIIDSEWEDIVAWEVVLFISSWEIQPMSFEYWEIFEWWWLMQKLSSDKLRILWFWLKSFRWKWIFGKLLFQSIWDIKETKLWFKAEDWKIYSSISTKWWKNVLYDVYDWSYSFYKWDCLYSWNSSVWNNVVDDVSYINAQYVKQMENMISIWKQQQLYHKIIYYSISLVVILILLYLSFRFNLFSKFSLLVGLKKWLKEN